MKFRIQLAVLVLFCVISVGWAAAGENLREMNVQETPNDYVADLRRGGDLNLDDAVRRIVVNRRIDRSTLSALRRELATGTTPVRENVVKLLGKIGLALDSPQPEKFPIIRDHSIIQALLVEGFAKDDSAASAAAGILRDRCRPADLAAFNDIYVKSLQQFRGDYLYLAAKAKSTKARPFVDSMADLPYWKKYEERLNLVKIAQAALGNTRIEDEFIKATREAEENVPAAPRNPFYNVGAARDGTEVAARLSDLGFIGTVRSLLVVCSYLRSPLKSYVPNVSERSIRYDALDAIRYNFPDERTLYRPTKLVEWGAAETFCTQHIGAVFEGPTPDLPPDLPYPTHMLPRPIRGRN